MMTAVPLLWKPFPQTAKFAGSTGNIVFEHHGRDACRGKQLLEAAVAQGLCLKLDAIHCTAGVAAAGSIA
jgi:hypothetical protein